MQQEKPYSQACENNKPFILEKLTLIFHTPATILEVGTGTGQHAVHFAGHLPHLTWQPSDHPDNYQLCQPWLEDCRLGNILAPVALDVGEADWPVPEIHGAFSANTAHIMAWEEVQAMFSGLGQRLPENGAFCLYGPFNYNGTYTSDSNRQFDQYLRARNARMGIRHIEDMEAMAGDNDLFLESDFEMPANNRFLVWRKR
ncbi:DUF938 domain-containing protein [Marinobacter sp. DUT-3]|uniref:DUF938 domain-containing protein n=1 Tax=Marinobacter sp. DUT-3 TaxID=3412036 RepID=UPI003D17D6F1